MLSVTKKPLILSVITLSAITLSVIVLSVIMLNVVVLSVVAPAKRHVDEMDWHQSTKSFK
jgi:hypothetical protein